MRGRQEAADVAQDVAVEVLRSLHRLRDPQAFDAWVHRITVRHASAQLHHASRTRAAETPLALLTELDEPSHLDGLDAATLLAARGALAAALADLPPRQRLALALRYVHDLSDAEIGAALGCRDGTVHALLSRGRIGPAPRSTTRPVRIRRLPMTDVHDETLRSAFSAARRLEPTEAEVAAIVARAAAAQALPRAAGRRSRSPIARGRRLALTGAAAAVVLAGGYTAAPPVRAAIDDLTGTFSGWLGGDTAQAPGRPLGGAEEAPDFLHDPSLAEDPRVIAEAGGYKLFAARSRSGSLTFELGNTGVGLGGGFDEDFREHAIFVLGPGAMGAADAHGHVPLFGVVSRSVASVELTYDNGPALLVDNLEGGFVLLAEPDRSPRAVVALDASGRELERRLVDDSKHPCPCIDWSQYEPRR